MNKRKEILLLVFLFLMALCLRLIPVFKGKAILFFDGAFEASLGRELVQGNIKEGLHGFYPPLYPLMIGITSLIIKDTALAMQLISVFFGSLIIFPVFLLTKHLYNSKVALLTSFFITIHPFMIYISKGMNKEIVFLFFIILFIWINFLATKKKAMWLFYVGGLIIGLSYLTKGEGINYLILFVIYNIFLFLKNKKMLIKTAIFILIGFITVSFYYIWFLSNQEGKLSFSSRLEFALLHKGNYMPRMEKRAYSLVDGYLTPGHIAQTLGRRYVLPGGIIGYYRINGYKELKETLRNIYRVFNYILPDFLPLFFIIFITLHFLNMANNKLMLRENCYILFFVIFVLLLYTPIEIRHRRLLPCLPIFFMWASNGINIFTMNIKEKFKGNKNIFLNKFGKGLLLKFIVIIFLTLFLLPDIFKSMELGKGKHYIDREHYSQQMYMQSLDSGFVEHKEVGLWLKDHLPKDIRIMSFDYAFAFYQGVNPARTHFIIPYAPYDKIIDFAKYNKINYIIISSALSHYRPFLSFLLEEDNIPSELNLVYKYPSNNKSGMKKVLVYKINYAGNE